MARRLGVAVACVFLLAPIAAVGKPVAAENAFVPPGSYVELFRKILAERPTAKPGRLHERVAVSEAAMRLWRKTREAGYRKQALDGFSAVLADPAFSLKDFHVLQGFGRLLVLLQRENLIRPADHTKLKEVAVAQLKAFCQSTDDGDNNIRLAQVLGYACLLEFLQGEPYPERAAVRKRLADYWSLICKTGDLDEDASNYDSLGIAFLIDLARILGREEDLKQSPGFRRMFERGRDIVSPGGLIPEYGDSYFAYLGCSLDRVYALEYAARLFEDPTFLSAARKLYHRPQASLPSLDSWYRALPLIDLDLSISAPRQPGGEPSLVMYRARRGSPAPRVDKLILRTGHAPGDAMILMDLYASGSHAHPEKGPSIAYYETSSVPLFHNLGRHRTRSALTANLLWALPEKERFPGCWNKEKSWFTMRIPVDYLHPEGNRFVIAPEMSLRNFQEHNRGCRRLFFDNLRLDGPAGVCLVDGFENPMRWEAKVRKATNVVLSQERTQGPFSERIDWQALPSTELKRKLADPPTKPFREEDYTHLKLDVRYEGARPFMHIRGLGKQVDLGDQFLVSNLERASAEQRGKDASGRLEYPSYLTADSTLTRRLVLTAEGCLVVHDVLIPGKSLDGWTAGQLWQLYELKAKGADWFCAADDGAYPASDGARQTQRTRRMLVRFAAGEQGEYGVEEIQQGYHCPNPKGRRADRFFTTFSKRKVTAGRKEAFTLAVLPHDPAEGAPEQIAARVRIQYGADGAVTVNFGAVEKNITVAVQIDEHGWRVKR